MSIIGAVLCDGAIVTLTRRLSALRPPADTCRRQTPKNPIKRPRLPSGPSPERRSDWPAA